MVSALNGCDHVKSLYVEDLLEELVLQQMEGLHRCSGSKASSFPSWVPMFPSCQTF